MLTELFGDIVALATAAAVAPAGATPARQMRLAPLACGYLGYLWDVQNKGIQTNKQQQQLKKQNKTRSFNNKSDVTLIDKFKYCVT